MVGRIAYPPYSCWAASNTRKDQARARQRRSHRWPWWHRRRRRWSSAAALHYYCHRRRTRSRRAYNYFRVLGRIEFPWKHVLRYSPPSDTRIVRRFRRWSWRGRNGIQPGSSTPPENSQFPTLEIKKNIHIKLINNNNKRKKKEKRIVGGVELEWEMGMSNNNDI